MKEIGSFYNEGFGWICRPCELERASVSKHRHSRAFREGEAESKNPSLANAALAKMDRRRLAAFSLVHAAA